MQELRTFIAEQEQSGRVCRVTEPLAAHVEAGARLAREEGRIVVLENVIGYTTPVVAGLVSSRPLVAAALGVEPGEVNAALLRARQQPQPVVPVADAPFLQTKLDSQALDSVVPLLTFQPGAARPYASAAIVAARSRRHGMNLSFHRMMYLGGNRFSVRIVPRHLRMILDESGGEAEVAVLLGVHPAVCIAAATSAEPDFDELGMASALLGGLEAVTLGGLTIPAGCELVLAGRITTELAEEGPFVDLTGTLDGVRQQQVLRVSAIYARPDFLYQTIVPGGLEHRLLMGAPQEPRIYQAVSNSVPSLVAVALSSAGCNWLHAVVALRQPRPGQAKNAGLAALAAHPSLKRVVVVDEDIDVLDAEQVEWAIATRVQPDRDLIVVPGCHGSSLDPSRDAADNTTAKWIIDATIPPGRERSEFVRAG
jgi:2,5-furandicarboxylate decarboxylase 1